MDLTGQSRELNSILAVESSMQGGCVAGWVLLKLVCATGQGTGHRAKTGNRVLRSGRDFKGDSD